MERRTVYIILIIALFAAGLVGTGLFSRPPVISVTGASVSSLNLSTLGLDIAFAVENRYPVAIPVKSLQYSVAYQSGGVTRILGEGEQLGLRMNPGSQSITIPVNISNPALIGSAWEVLKSGEIHLLINGSVTPDLFGITPAIPFGREITVPVNTGSILSGIGSLLGS